MKSSLWLCGLLVTCFGCSSSEDSDRPDAGARAVDSGTSGTGARDAGASDAAASDAGTGDVEVGHVEPSALFWVRSLRSSIAVTLLPRADDVVAVTLEQGTTVVRAVGIDGKVRWTQSFEAARPATQDVTRPVAVLGPTGNIYVALTSVATVAGHALDCTMDKCDALVTLSGNGELLSVRSLPLSFSESIALIDGGIVVASATGVSSTDLAAFSEHDEPLWQMPTLFTQLNAFVTGIGTDTFYFVDGIAFEVRRASDGSPIGRLDACATDCDVGVALGDGSLLLGAVDTNEPLRAFNTHGEALWSVQMVGRAWPTPHARGGFAFAPRDEGPIGVVDATGRPRWQWPGMLADGEVQGQMSGFCKASAVSAPNGGMYVASEACPKARELLRADPSVHDSDQLLSYVPTLDRDETGADAGD